MKYKNENRRNQAFSIVQDSEYSEEKAMASNSISILNAADTINFMQIDFNCCEIPYAILAD